MPVLGMHTEYDISATRCVVAAASRVGKQSGHPAAYQPIIRELEVVSEIDLLRAYLKTFQ